MSKQVIFISGIDTDCGKTVVTGLLAKYLLKKGKKVITQKLVQTGCEGVSEDILTHRKIMNIELLEEDNNYLTCPYIFKLPSSPHLAAKSENIEIDFDIITNSTNKLLEKFDIVLLEGAGGLLVPLNHNFTTFDYIQKNNYPIILVSSSKLGSINHTLLSLELIKNKGLDLIGLIYNEFPDKNSVITEDSKLYLKNYLASNFHESVFYSIPVMNDITELTISFGRLII